MKEHALDKEKDDLLTEDSVRGADTIQAKTKLRTHCIRNANGLKTQG